eukprot:jgi/Chlat1/8048/Chrsp73S07515
MAVKVEEQEDGPLPNGTVGAAAEAAAANGDAHDDHAESNGVEKSAGATSAAAERRRRRRKKKKDKAKTGKGADADASDEEEEAAPAETTDNVVVEYVTAKPELDTDDPAYDELRRIFEKFSTAEAPVKLEDGENGDDAEAASKPKGEGDDSDEEEKGEKGVSKKKKKLLRRLKVAELKQMCRRPEVVEVWDATAADPRLLVFLKAYRNSVPVPRHWSQKRKFLQGKRGIEKIPFQLPDFIAATGIEKIRQAYVEKEDMKKLKTKQRDKMQPKMGKLDIDYQVLHDAFFKYQTKPKLTGFGDLYYEGKEFEHNMQDKKPGYLSIELRNALGMPDNRSPPPWLVNMQRYGPPPSYPSLKIPGLNAPIPTGAQFGYAPGQWGKPPVDEYGRPLYGDVFGVQQPDEDANYIEPVDKSKHWGDLEEEEEEEEPEPEEEAEEEEEVDEEKIADGIASVDSMASVPSGVATPDVIDLRKAQRRDEDKPLYTVLEEREHHVSASEIMGSAHAYNVPGKKAVDLLKSQKTEKVDVTLRPEELEGLDDVALAAKYEEASKAEKDKHHREDFSDMVAEEARKRKRKQEQKDSKKDSKKAKDFKF